MVIYSIWRDTYFERYTVDDFVNFRVTMDGETIYRGRAYRFPDSDFIRVNVSLICRNYLNSEIPALMELVREGGWEFDDMIMPDVMHRFNLYEGENTAPSGEWYFVNNWDYETEVIDTQIVNVELNSLINRHYSPNMWRFGSSYNGTSNHCLTNPYSPHLYTVEACGDYALYYSNIKGGWNSFLIEGAVSAKENFTNHAYTKSFVNHTLDFNEKEYMSESTTTYTCTTGWLTDEESSAFVRNIGNCITLYLHDLNKDKIIPVVLTDNNFAVKTYRNQGKKLVNYTFNLRASQSKIRK